MLKKYALILGGNTKMGQFLVKEFKRKSIVARWRTLSIDHKKNLEATENLVIQRELSPQEQVEAALAKAKDFTEEFDAIIIANSEGDFQRSRISDDDIFEKYNSYWKSNVYRAILAARVGSNLLAPCGIMVFHSSLEAFEQTNPDNLAVNLSRMQACSISMNIGELKEVPSNCVITTILPKYLDTLANIEAKPAELDENTFDNCEHISKMIKTWSAGESRPENNSFVTFERATKKMTFPKFV